VTKIVYTITLINSDGSKASASTEQLEYPTTPAGKLKASAQAEAQSMEQMHAALSQMVKPATDGTRFISAVPR